MASDEDIADNARAVRTLTGLASNGNHPRWIAEDIDNGHEPSVAKLGDLVQQLEEAEPGRGRKYLGEVYQRLSPDTQRKLLATVRLAALKADEEDEPDKDNPDEDEPDEKECEQLQEELDALQDQLDEKSAERDELQADIDKLKAELEEIDAFLLENGPWDPPIESVEVPIPNPLRGIWRGVSEFLFAMAPKPLNEGEEEILYEAERKRKLQRRDQILKELAEKEPKLAKANQEVEDLEAKVGEAEEKLEECEDDDDKDKTNKTIKRFNPRGL